MVTPLTSRVRRGLSAPTAVGGGGRGLRPARSGHHQHFRSRAAG